MGNKKGFTLIELVIVIAVIGILSAISILGMKTFQVDARDERRATSIFTIADALERYYDKNGGYPSCAAMIASASTVSQKLGIRSNTLQAPSSINANSIICTDITTSTPGDPYAYVGDGTAACSTGSICTLYTLKYKDEGSGEIKSLTSRRGP